MRSTSRDDCDQYLPIQMIIDEEISNSIWHEKVLYKMRK